MCSISSILTVIYPTDIYTALNYIVVCLFAFIVNLSILFHSYCGQVSPLSFISKEETVFDHILYFYAFLQYQSAFGRANYGVFQSNLWDLRSFPPLLSMGKLRVGYIGL